LVNSKKKEKKYLENRVRRSNQSPRRRKKEIVIKNFSELMKYIKPWV
jgi:hypothetical protein